MTEHLFCTYKDDNGYCGRIRTHGDRCKLHIGKEAIIRKKSQRFRGDSEWQLEQGMGTSKTGSNV